MARQLQIEFTGAFYHVTSRRDERTAIFNRKIEKGQKVEQKNKPY
jgi:hypothetical protein